MLLLLLLGAAHSQSAVDGETAPKSLMEARDANVSEVVKSLPPASWPFVRHAAVPGAGWGWALLCDQAALADALPIGPLVQRRR